MVNPVNITESFSERMPRQSQELNLETLVHRFERLDSTFSRISLKLLQMEGNLNQCFIQEQNNLGIFNIVMLVFHVGAAAG